MPASSAAPAQSAADPEPPVPAVQATSDPSPAPAAPSAPAAPLTRAEISELERATERGRLLIAIARAGILATQDMLTRISDPEGAGISGWIAEPAGNAMDVTFYASGDEPVAIYRASVTGGRIVSREVFLGTDRPALTMIQSRMAAARAATDRLDNQACSGQPFNVLIVQRDGNADIDVFSTARRNSESLPDRARISGN